MYGSPNSKKLNWFKKAMAKANNEFEKRMKGKPATNFVCAVR